MNVFLRKIVAPLVFSIGLLPAYANARVLPIAVIMQGAPEWSFAASSAMILQYLGYPKANSADNYQCGIVSAQGGICSMNCSACLDGGRTTQRVAGTIQMYADFVHRVTGYMNPHVHLNVVGILSSQQIISQIDQEGPILAGINPGHIPYPAELGISQHAVVIVGYEGTPENLNVVINDPYPYPPTRDPYVLSSAFKIQQGQYSIPHRILVGIFNYRNSLTFR
jgi:hypothetical protein